jgi:predicted Rossmann fold nucleotide-binding protein DprA/Smf involved in DNA uptake
VKLAIVGSQLKAWPTRDLQAKARWYIEVAFKMLKPSVLVSGGASGVDSWAEDYADAYDIEKMILRPQVDHPDWEAFRTRNILIANQCDQLVCIRSTRSNTFGSGWTANYAEDLGRKVWRLEA